MLEGWQNGSQGQPDGRRYGRVAVADTGIARKKFAVLVNARVEAEPALIYMKWSASRPSGAPKSPGQVEEKDTEAFQAGISQAETAHGVRFRTYVHNYLMRIIQVDFKEEMTWQKSTKPTRNLALELVRVTEAAALAAGRYMGRGDKEAADKAAVDAMRLIMNTIPMEGVVIIGEGEKDEAPMLFNGEILGTGESPKVDIAVDPIDGTRPSCTGRNNSIATVAMAPRGTMFNPGPFLYMNKIAVGPEAKDVIDINAPVKDNLKKIARVKGRKCGRPDGGDPGPSAPRGTDRRSAGLRGAHPADTGWGCGRCVDDRLAGFAHRCTDGHRRNAGRCAGSLCLARHGWDNSGETGGAQ